jgi:hypothetical protein
VGRGRRRRAAAHRAGQLQNGKNDIVFFIHEFAPFLIIETSTAVESGFIHRAEARVNP